MTSTKNKEGEEAEGTKFWPNFLMVVHGFWKRGFFSVICKDFLHFCGCLVLHCFLETSSNCSLIIVIRGTKAYHESRLNERLFAFLSALLYLWNLQTLCALQKKQAMYEYIDLTVEA